MGPRASRDIFGKRKFYFLDTESNNTLTDYALPAFVLAAIRRIYHAPFDRWLGSCTWSYTCGKP